MPGILALNVPKPMPPGNIYESRFQCVNATGARHGGRRGGGWLGGKAHCASGPVDALERGPLRHRAAGTAPPGTAGNPSGSCVEVAALADGRAAVRNSRHPSGPALVYTSAKIAAFLPGAKAAKAANSTTS